MKRLLLFIAFLLISCNAEIPTEMSKEGDYRCAGYVFTGFGFHNDCVGTPNDPSRWVRCEKRVKKEGDYCKPAGHRWQCK